jgi:transcription elongation factor Elf1
MIDELENFGRDDNFKCENCGSETYLTFEDGNGLNSYDCDNCGENFQVQFEFDDEREDDEYCYDYDPYDL